MNVQDVRVAILATNGFEQVELLEPRKALDEAGAKTLIVAPQGPEIRGWDDSDWGEFVKVDVEVRRANPADFDALFLPGGVLNPDQLRMDPAAISFARAFFDFHKPVAAICHGPQTLIEAGVLRGRRMTSYAAVKTDMQNAGAEWVDEPVVVDDNLLTSRNPGDIPVFTRAMLKLFAERAPAIAW